MDADIVPLFREDDPYFLRAQKICSALPGAERTERWGHCIFTVEGTPFAAYPASTSFPHSIALRAASDSIELAQNDLRYVHGRFFDHRPWIARDLLITDVDWAEVQALVAASYAETQALPNTDAG